MPARSRSRSESLLTELSSIPGRERLLRRMLRLPAEAPDPVGYDFVPSKEKDGFFTIEHCPEDVLARRQAEWHAEDWRADAAEWLARSPKRVADLKSQAENRLYAARAARALARARVLTFTSHYLHPTSGCMDIEGYFTFGPDLSFGLQIVAADAIGSYATDEWTRGEFVSGGSTVLGWGVHVLVPGPEVTPDLAAEALRRWYKDRFEFTRRHWTHLTGEQPTITLDLSWEDEETPNAHLQSIR